VKNSKNLIMFFSMMLVFSIILSSCSIEKDNKDQSEQTAKNKSSNNVDKTADKYSAQGKIVKIDDNGLHVQIGDKVERYNVTKEKADIYYAGEYVGLNELQNNTYDVFEDETYDYNNRFTSTGDQIMRISGTVGEVQNNFVTAVTEMGDVKLTNPGKFSLKSGDQVMFDYVEMAGGNQMISYYEETSKINVEVKEISRDTSGIMRIFAVSSDNKEYEIQVNENTVTNFAHSSLLKGENITVYPSDISGDIPAIVKCKLIVKD